MPSSSPSSRGRNFLTEHLFPYSEKAWPSGAWRRRLRRPRRLPRLLVSLAAGTATHVDKRSPGGSHGGGQGALQRSPGRDEWRCALARLAQLLGYD